MEYPLFLLMSFMCVFSTNPDFKRAKQCYVSVGYNIDYQGTMNRTSTGAGCIDWKVTTWASSDFDGTMDNNYCRNPDKDVKGPWCITRSGKREYCTIPKCASSAMFDGNGNIDHQFRINSTTSDNISLAFYTNEEWQDDATLFAIRTWRNGLLQIKLTSKKSAGVKDILTLKWKFEYGKPALTLSSRQGQANGDLVRVNVVRNRRNLKMFVNGIEHTTVISEETSSNAVFEWPGNIFIGKSPYAQNGFKGCIADVNYNSIRPLDMAMGSRPKSDGETIKIARGVWEGCLLIPPSDWVVPVIPPTVIPNEVEVALEPETDYVVVKDTTHSGSLTDIGTSRTFVMLTMFLFLVFG